MYENQKSARRGSPHVTPRWVKLFVILFIALILLVVVLHFMGFDFGRHGATGILTNEFVRYTLLLMDEAQPL